MYVCSQTQSERYLYLICSLSERKHFTLLFYSTLWPADRENCLLLTTKLNWTNYRGKVSMRKEAQRYQPWSRTTIHTHTPRQTYIYTHVVRYIRLSPGGKCGREALLASIFVHFFTHSVPRPDHCASITHLMLWLNFNNAICEDV